MKPRVPDTHWGRFLLASSIMALLFGASRWFLAPQGWDASDTIIFAIFVACLLLLIFAPQEVPPDDR